MYNSNNIVLLETKLLKKFTQEEIVYMLFSELRRGSRKVRNILRDDKNPGATFSYTETGDLVLRDFAYGNKPLTVTEILSQLRDKLGDSNYAETLKYLLDQQPEKIVFNFTNVYRPTEKNESDYIVVKPRDWQYKDYNYWFKKYALSRKLLEDNYVIPIEAYFYTNSLYSDIQYPYLAYMYVFDENCKQLYIPEIKDIQKKMMRMIASKDRSCNKFFSKDYYMSKHLIITKSMKDYLVLTSLGFRTKFLLSETYIPSFKELEGETSIYVLYDNDSVGKRRASILSKLLRASVTENVKEIFVRHKTAKDAADLVEVLGQEAAKNHILRLMFERQTKKSKNTY